MSTSNTVQEEIELSIIILSYNTVKITYGCLESIFNSLHFSHLSYEVIVFDNASTDDSPSMLKAVQEKHPRLKIMLNKENLGFAKGNNRASEKAKGKYLLFLNSDIIVLKNAIEKLLSFYKENQNKVSFCGGKLLNPDSSSQPSCGAFYSLPIVFAALFLKGDYWGLTRSSPDSVRQVDWVSGACILTNKERFSEVGSFDERIFMYMEEVDLLYRARMKKMMTYIYPDAQFIHLGSASSGGKTFPILQVYNGFLYFYKKHHSRSAMKLLRVMLQLKAVISLLIGRLTGNTYLTSTYEKAYKIASMD